MNFIRRNTLGRVEQAVDAVDRRISGIDNTIDYVVERTGSRLGSSLGAKFMAKKGRQLGDLPDCDVKYNVFDTMNPPVSAHKGKLMVTTQSLEDAYNEGKPASEQMTFVMKDNGVMTYVYKYEQNDADEWVKGSVKKATSLKKWNTEAQEHIQLELSTIITNLAQETTAKALLHSMIGGESMSFAVKEGEAGTQRVVKFSISQLYTLLTEYRTGDIEDNTVKYKLVKAVLTLLQKKGAKNASHLDVESLDKVMTTLFTTELSDLKPADEAAYKKMYKKNYGQALRSGNSTDVFNFGVDTKKKTTDTSTVAKTSTDGVKILDDGGEKDEKAEIGKLIALIGNDEISYDVKKSELRHKLLESKITLKEHGQLQDILDETHGMKKTA